MDRSSISVVADQTAPLERKSNLSYLRNLYGLLFLELLITFIWSSFIVSYPKSFTWVTKVWWLCLIALIIAGILLAFSLLSPASSKPPVNMVVFGVFTLCLAFGVGWLCQADGSLLVYFTLTTLTSISFGFALYAR